jgi:hypothetical protein
MLKQLMVMAVAIILLCAPISCQRVNTQPDVAKLVDLTSIPTSYGNLISVTSIARYPDWVQLWFQDSEGTIRIVRVMFDDNMMHKDIKTITRN